MFQLIFFSFKFSRSSVIANQTRLTVPYYKKAVQVVQFDLEISIFRQIQIKLLF